MDQANEKRVNVQFGVNGAGPRRTSSRSFVRRHEEAAVHALGIEEHGDLAFELLGLIAHERLVHKKLLV